MREAQRSGAVPAQLCPGRAAPLAVRGPEPRIPLPQLPEPQAVPGARRLPVRVGPRAALPAALLGQLLQHPLALLPFLGQLLLVGHGPQRGDHVGDPLAEGLPGPGPLLPLPFPRHGIGLGLGRPHAQSAALPRGALQRPDGLVPLLLAPERHEGERLPAEQLDLVRAQPVLGQELLHVVEADVLGQVPNLHLVDLGGEQLCPGVAVRVGGALGRLHGAAPRDGSGSGKRKGRKRAAATRFF